MCLNIRFVFFVLMWTTYGFVSFLDPFILFIHSFYTVTVQFPSTQALQNIMENVKVSSEGRATFLRHVFLFFHCTHCYQQLGVTASALITLTTHCLDYLKNSTSQLVSCVFRSKWSFSFQNQTNKTRGKTCPDSFSSSEMIDVVILPGVTIKFNIKVSMKKMI